MLITLGDVHQLSVQPRTPTPVESISYPAVAAHRGGRALYPEGSMDAFRAVVADHPGMPLEMDVRPLADGTLVVCHDDTVDRIAADGTTGRVDQMTQAQWKNLRVKNLDGTVTGPAAFLQDVLDEFGGTNTVMLIECKVYTGSARNRYVEQCWPYRDQIIAASFSPNTARILAGSGFAGQYLATKPVADIPEWAGHVAIDHTTITPAVVAEVHAAGSRLWAWTVDSVARKDELFGMGVDGIFTDDPTI
ncbi:hypothetical protein JTF08_13770 [Micrococcaceae bacterium RIT802]|nr:hypothetical protein [Micrococcaceae bacterium RIT 802]